MKDILKLLANSIRTVIDQHQDKMLESKYMLYYISKVLDDAIRRADDELNSNKKIDVSGNNKELESKIRDMLYNFVGIQGCVELDGRNIESLVDDIEHFIKDLAKDNEVKNQQKFGIEPNNEQSPIVMVSDDKQYYAVSIETGTDDDHYKYHVHHTLSGNRVASIERLTKRVDFDVPNYEDIRTGSYKLSHELINFCSELTKLI